MTSSIRNIRKLLIANRGEIAVRIIRAARELGITTVQVHSTADADSLATKMADIAVEIGPPHAKKSYLNQKAILQAAQDADVDAIHPGYGFLAENADFADAVVTENLIFVGPNGDTIRKMGDKVSARQLAAVAGVPIVLGSQGRVADIDQARQIALDIGFPLVIKAVAGGGGRGIRVINHIEEFESQFPLASAEALAAFGDGALYIEKYVEQARHIEVQVLADGETAIHLFERECSLQRRKQKVWEEAPSATLAANIKALICDAAVKLTKAVGYSGAGTVEFLYDDNSDDFYFLEMNTRIQVEHPVTEFITGIDLIREMIKIADGNKLLITQDQVRCYGHAIEVRINAEDPSKDFLPMPGTITDVHFPDGLGVRFDGLIYPGCTISPFYDSLLGKLIVWDEDRSSAINRLKRALTEFKVNGLQTTKPLFDLLVDEKDICNGTFDTKWLEQWLVNNSKFLNNKEEKPNED